MPAPEHRTKVTILTGTFRIEGYIDVLPGYRVTDYLAEAKGFLAVTDAEIRELAGREVFSAPFIDISRDHIVVVAPAG